jgi:hypothetical protein
MTNDSDSTPMKTTIRFVDKYTHEPCPTRDQLLCTIRDRNHRHVAEHMVERHV